MPRPEEPRSEDQHLPRGGGPAGMERPKIEIKESAKLDLDGDLDDSDSEPEELPDDPGAGQDDT